MAVAILPGRGPRFVAEASCDRVRARLRRLPVLLPGGPRARPTSPPSRRYRYGGLAALDILVREAGGAFISLDGTAGPHGGSAVATNGLLHQQVLSRLRGA